jgi:hypothetical protein
VASDPAGKVRPAPPKFKTISHDNIPRHDPKTRSQDKFQGRQLRKKIGGINKAGLCWASTGLIKKLTWHQKAKQDKPVGEQGEGRKQDDFAEDQAE